MRKSKKSLKMGMNSIDELKINATPDKKKIFLHKLPSPSDRKMGNLSPLMVSREQPLSQTGS